MRHDECKMQAVPKTSVIKRKNILTQSFKKSKLIQKSTMSRMSKFKIENPTSGSGLVGWGGGPRGFVSCELNSRLLELVVCLAHRFPFSLGSYKTDLSCLLPLQLNSEGRCKQPCNKAFHADQRGSGTPENE